MKKKCVWITGANGSLGSQIAAKLANSGYRLLCTDMDVDVAELEAVSMYADREKPDVIINCAVYRKDLTQKEDKLEMYRVNAIGAKNIAIVSEKHHAKLIHISTDDVFAGDVSVELNEFDQTHPSTDYGKSKLAGERFVQSINPRHLIIRSSWVYNLEGDNFLTYILKMAEDTQILSVPNDLISTPTSADELAGVIVKMIELDEYGVFHVSCEGSCSRYGFAHAILDYAGISSMQLVPVLTSAKDVRARYTVLDNMMLKMTGIYQMPDWRDALKACLSKRFPQTK